MESLSTNKSGLHHSMPAFLTRSESTCGVLSISIMRWRWPASSSTIRNQRLLSRLSINQRSHTLLASQIQGMAPCSWKRQASSSNALHEKNHSEQPLSVSAFLQGWGHPTATSAACAALSPVKRSGLARREHGIKGIRHCPSSGRAGSPGWKDLSYWPGRKGGGA